MVTPNLLSQAIQAIQNGDKKTGKRLLAQVLLTDPHNPQAWLLMSDLVDTPQQRRDCLLRVLDIDPQNQLAQTRLAQGASSAASVRVDPPAETTGESSPPTRVPQRTPLSILDAKTAEPDDATHKNTEREQKEPHHQRGYRNILLAGALTISLICGIILLAVTITTIIPQAQKRAQERLQSPPETILYMATLWCPPCEQAGSNIILWEKVGDGISRGGKAGELPHQTTVSVLAQEWSEPEGRFYYKVAAQGQKGWVPETFIRE